MGITSKQYNSFQKAYAHFNRTLFGGILPECLITLQRDGKAYGYFWAEQFSKRTGDGRTDEIALNPDGFVFRTDAEILSTLVHEMCHLWQHHYGKPSRSGYHNFEWATKMIEVGLMPTATGLVGGKMTGQNMTHMMIPDGAFLKAYRRLVSQRGYKLTWQSAPEVPTSLLGAKKRASKTKYTCPNCGANAWAKPGAMLICGHCYEDTWTEDGAEIYKLVAETPEGDGG